VIGRPVAGRPAANALPPKRTRRWPPGWEEGGVPSGRGVVVDGSPAMQLAALPFSRQLAHTHITDFARPTGVYLIYYVYHSMRM